MKRALPAVLFALHACAPSSECGQPVFDTQSHRGGRAQRPENTLPAFEYALSHGVRTLEMDLAVTSDDVIVLSHDPILPEGRCVKADGSPADGMKLRQMTFAEVRQLDCGKNQDKDFPNQLTVEKTHPPTLLEVIALGEARGGGAVRYNIEPKMDPEWGDDVTPDAESFTRLVEDAVTLAGVGDRVTIQSFDPRPLHALHARGSNLKRIVLFPSDHTTIVTAWALNNVLETAKLVDAVAISSYGPVTRKPFVDDAHLKGFAVIPWTINDRADMDRLADMGVDGIISDDVDLLMDWSKSRSFTGGVCW